MVDVGDKAETDRVAVAEAVVRMTPGHPGAGGRGDGQEGRRVLHRPAGRASPRSSGRPTGSRCAIPVRVVGSDVALTGRPPPARACASASRCTPSIAPGWRWRPWWARRRPRLTIYDMVKGVERGVEIGAVRLLEKRGGRSGHWRIAPPVRCSRVANRRRHGAAGNETRGGLRNPSNQEITRSMSTPGTAPRSSSSVPVRPGTPPPSTPPAPTWSRSCTRGAGR